MRNKSVLLLFIIILSTLSLLVNCNKKKVNEKIQIILISVDTLRGDHLSSYGYFRDTSPHLSKLVKDSVYYPNAYPNGCWTMPSHMSLLTGTFPSRHGIDKDWASIKNKKFPKLNDSVKNIAEVLKSYNINLKTLKFARLPNELGFGRGYDKNFIIDTFHSDKLINKVLKELEKAWEEIKEGKFKEKGRKEFLESLFKFLYTNQHNKLDMNNINFEAIFTKKHHYWRNLLIVLFIAVVIASVWWVQIEQESPAPEQTVNPLCAEFSPVEGGVTCEEVIELALEEYPGEVYEINKAKSQTKDFWIIDINGENKAKIFVDIKGNIIRIDFPEG